jgi:outer membrane lipoprotein SlyB
MNGAVRRGGLWACLFAAVLTPAGCTVGGRYGGGFGGYSSSYGSSSSGSNTHLTSDEQLLREQSNSFVDDNVFGGAATGAVVGCLLGGVLGALLGGRASSAAIGCGAGAAGGAIVGGVDGYMNAKAAQNQSNKILMTRSVTSDIRKENAKLETAVQTAQRVVDADQKKLDQIKADLAAKTITIENARAQAAVIRQNSDEIAQILDAARKNRDNFVDARNKLQGGVDTSQLDQEIAQLNGEIDQLQNQLASVNTSLSLTGLN